MHPREAAALRRRIQAADDLSETDRDEALSYVSTAPSLSIADEVKELSPEAREGVYRAALGIALLDRELAAEESVFLSRLRGALGFDEATLERLEAESR